ncbi:hypothetical protein JCM3765_002117 [Sporobolomyces pararoseus]
MSDQEQQGGRGRYDRKAKTASVPTGENTIGNQNLVAPSTEDKKNLSPLQPALEEKKVDLPVDIWLMSWSSSYYHFEKVFLREHHNYWGKHRKQEQIQRRESLYFRYSKLKGDDPFYPVFSVFTELPSVRDFWEPKYALDAAIEEEWTAHQDRINREVPAAQRWIRLSLARLLSHSLAQIGKPLSSQVHTSLHPQHCLLPRRYFDGIRYSHNSTGLLLRDNATVSATDLEELLDRFSNQAWFLNERHQQTQSLTSALRDNLGRHTKLKSYYNCELFPKFNNFWHQILSQVLEKSGIEDGPQGEVTKKLEALGTCFSCGACGVDGEETELMTAIELLKHFKDHGFPAEGTPQDSLVVYHSLEAEENDEGLEASTENTL